MTGRTWASEAVNAGVKLAPLERLTQIGHHPQLPRSVAAMAQAMLDLSATEPMLDLVFKDAGRYCGAMWAVHLFEAGGLTLPRLRSLGVQSRMLSPGRAQALLDLMTHYGLVVAQEGCGRTRRYALTEQFMKAWLRCHRATLQAAVALEPSLCWLLEAADPAVLRTFGAELAAAYLQVSVAHANRAEAMPLFEVFLHARAGPHMLWRLLLASHEGVFPPQTSGPVTIHGLAQRLGVSRIHVRRVFDKAQARELITLDKRGLDRFSESARLQLHYLWAGLFFLVLEAAARTAERRRANCVIAPT